MWKWDCIKSLPVTLLPLSLCQAAAEERCQRCKLNQADIFRYAARTHTHTTTTKCEKAPCRVTLMPMPLIGCISDAKCIFHFNRCYGYHESPVVGIGSDSWQLNCDVSEDQSHWASTVSQGSPTGKDFICPPKYSENNNYNNNNNNTCLYIIYKCSVCDACYTNQWLKCPFPHSNISSNHEPDYFPFGLDSESNGGW